MMMMIPPPIIFNKKNTSLLSQGSDKGIWSSDKEITSRGKVEEIYRKTCSIVPSSIMNHT
jgi:hypothetical protein